MRKWLLLQVPVIILDNLETSSGKVLTPLNIETRNNGARYRRNEDESAFHAVLITVRIKTVGASPIFGRIKEIAEFGLTKILF